MTVGTDTPDQPQEPPRNDDQFRKLFGRDGPVPKEPPAETKKPKPAEYNSMDFLSQLLGADPAMVDKARLAQQLEGNLDRTLKLLQVIALTKQVFGEKEADKLARHYKAGLELLAEGADEAVKIFQKRYGEL